MRRPHRSEVQDYRSVDALQAEAKLGGSYGAGRDKNQTAVPVVACRRHKEVVRA